MPKRKRRPRQTAYRVEFAQSVQAHLRALPAGDRAVVLDAIERQLSDQPLVETRHRKPVRPNPIAPWQLSVRDLRVFYEVGPEGERAGQDSRGGPEAEERLDDRR